MTAEIHQLPAVGMHINDVILAGDPDRGAKALLGLSLVFTPAGIQVRGAQPDSQSLLAWSGLDGAHCNERVVLPDLRSAAVLEFTSEGQSIRFLLPFDSVSPGQAAYLELAVPVWLTLYKGAASPIPDLVMPSPATTLRDQN